jgi:hypothetical protein
LPAALLAIKPKVFFVEMKTLRFYETLDYFNQLENWLNEKKSSDCITNRNLKIYKAFLFCLIELK